MVDLVGLQNLLGLIAALCIGSYIKKRFFESAKHSWKSPFIEDSRKPLTPMVTDQVRCSKFVVLFQLFFVRHLFSLFQRTSSRTAFTPKLANEREWDAIVIGSGIGGMASAALLSKAGMKVLVLEKHDTCGGACHTFRDAGYEFDVGIHFIGNNFRRQTLNRTLMEQISDGQIQWASLDETYGRVFLDAMTPTQRDYDLRSGPNVMKNYLLKQFPDEHQAIETFYSMVKQVNSHLRTWVFAKFLPVWLSQTLCLLGLSRFFTFFALSGRTLKETVEGLTKNKDLQFLFSHNWPIHGSPPGNDSFVLEAIVHGHFEHGACYPVGGGLEIPYRIIPVTERSGGRVLMKANVTQILTEGGKVTGVRVGSKGSCTTVDIHAPIVISDAGIHTTLLSLLPESVAKMSPTWPITNSIKQGVGIISMFIGLRGTAEELGLKKENIWAYFDSSAQDSFDHIFEGKVLEDMLDKPYPGFNVGFPSAVDPTWESRYPGRSTITVLSFLPHALVAKWSDLTVKKRCDEYNATKNAVGQQIVDQVIHLYPKLKNAIDYCSVGTPITYEHYLNSREGSAYGLEHCFERFTLENSSLLRPESGIDGLFFCGQDILIAGILSALLSGFMCAGVVLNQKITILNDLIRLHKKLKTDHTLNEDDFFV